MLRPALLSVTVAALVTGCATVPTGPSMPALAGRAKAFEQFQIDDAACRQWATHSIGGTPGDAAAQSTVTGAAIGTAAGAAAGALIGAAAGNPATGAAVGAGTGLFMGTASGASAGYAYAGDAQRRYDAAYQQCMYAKGNQVPVVVRAARPYQTQPYRYPPPPPPPRSQPPAGSEPSPASQSPSGPPPPSGSPPPSGAPPPPGYRPPPPGAPAPPAGIQPPPDPSSVR